MDEVEQNIRQAYEIVKRSDITEPYLKREAFKFALASFTDVGPRPVAQMQSAASLAATATQSAYEKIAFGLSLSIETVELLYDIRHNELTLNLSGKTLPSSVSAAMREIAILLAVGMKHAELGAGATFEHIRTVCAEYGKLDKRNFAAAMAGMKPRLLVSGRGSERELVPKRPADDIAKELVRRYAQNV